MPEKKAAASRPTPASGPRSSALAKIVRYSQALSGVGIRDRHAQDS